MPVVHRSRHRDWIAVDHRCHVQSIGIEYFLQKVLNATHVDVCESANWSAKLYFTTMLIGIMGVRIQWRNMFPPIQPTKIYSIS